MGVVDWKQVDMKEEGDGGESNLFATKKVCSRLLRSQQGVAVRNTSGPDPSDSEALFDWALVLLCLFHDPLALKLQACSRLGMFKFSLIMHSILTSLSPKGPHCTLPHTNLPWTAGSGPKVRTRTPLATNSAQTSDEGATSPTELVQPNANH